MTAKFGVREQGRREFSIARAQVPTLARGGKFGRVVRLAGVCVALFFSAAVRAQSGADSGELINQLLKRALQGAQKQGAAADGNTQAQQSGGYLDTPENLQKVVAEARNRSAAAAVAPSADCQRALSQMRPARWAGTGYVELLAKCEAEVGKDIAAQQRGTMQAEQRRADLQRERNSDAEKRADNYEAARVQFLADLKAGSKKPVNCAQWMVARGHAAPTLKSNEISKVAYRAPLGLGYFEARVQRIEGDTFLASVEDEGHFVLIEVKRSTELFKANQLRVQSTVAVVGTQTATRKLTRADGSTVTLAVVVPACLGEGPHPLLDLAPS